jgi:hypothetical protein
MFLFPMPRKWAILTVAAFCLARPALAGPPYVSDDPEPTDYKHFEIYTFNNGTVTRGDIGGATGIDFNYGAAPDLQLTATLPAAFDRPAASRTNFGLGNIELAAKYRFLHQDTFGLDVSVFPRVFLPTPSKSVGSGRSSQNCCEAGGVVTYQLLPKLQLGVELFHQTADGNGTPATSSVGVGARYDINDNFHLLGYLRRGIENVDTTDRYSWYASVLFTF